jgi:hypothetical protein
MHGSVGSKSGILTIFQKSADWLDWPYPVSADLQNGPQDFFSLFSFIYFSPLSEVAPCLLVIQIQIQAVWFAQ